MGDLTSRKEALLTIGTEIVGVTQEGRELLDLCQFAIKNLSSAEPEIIRCKDCKYYYNNDPENIPTANIICFQMHEEDFCSYAERRTDEQTD